MEKRRKNKSRKYYESRIEKEQKRKSRKEKRIVLKVQWENFEGVLETWQIIERKNRNE